MYLSTSRSRSVWLIIPFVSDSNIVVRADPIICRSRRRTFSAPLALLTSSSEAARGSTAVGFGRGGRGIIRSGSEVSNSFFFQNARVARLMKFCPLNRIGYLRLNVLIASSRETVALADNF